MANLWVRACCMVDLLASGLTCDMRTGKRGPRHTDSARHRRRSGTVGQNAGRTTTCVKKKFKGARKHGRDSAAQGEYLHLMQRMGILFQAQGRLHSRVRSEEGPVTQVITYSINRSGVVATGPGRLRRERRNPAEE